MTPTYSVLYRGVCFVLEGHAKDFPVLNMQNSIALAFVKQKLHQGGDDRLGEGYRSVMVNNIAAGGNDGAQLSLSRHLG